MNTAQTTIEFWTKAQGTPCAGKLPPDLEQYECQECNGIGRVGREVICSHCEGTGISSCDLIHWNETANVLLYYACILEMNKRNASKYNITLATTIREMVEMEGY